MQIGERRVAGAEVVHGDTHAEGRELVQRADGVRGAVHDRRLGDLELEAAWRQGGLYQDRLDRLHDVLLPELARREVHRDLHPRVPQIEPHLALAAGLLQGPQADRHDEPAFLRDRNELGGRYHPLLVIPAQQRLGAQDAAGLQRHDRLKVQHEFMALQGAPQLQLQLRVPLGARRHVVREALEVVAPFALGVVHGEVGVAQQRVGVLVVHRIDRQTDARREVELMARDLGAFGYRCEQALRNLRDFVEVGRLEQHGELVVTRRAGYRCCAGLTAGGAPPRSGRVAHLSGASLISLELSRSRIITASRLRAVGARDGVVQAVGRQRPVRQPVSDS